MKNSLTALFFVIPMLLSAQSVKVNQDKENVQGGDAEGYSVELDATAAEVESAFVKYIKAVGKSKRSGKEWSFATPIINGKTYALPVYALIRERGNKGTAFVGIKTSEWSSGSADVKKDIEKMVYDFGVFFYRERVQKQIDESTRAFEAVQREQQRLTNQNKTLTTQLENNKKQKIQIEKNLENNKIDFENLTKKLEKNKHDQDSVAVAAEQIRRVVEMQKEKQKKIN